MPSKFNVRVKLSICDASKRGFFGIGIVWILEEIERTGSIKQASKNLNMSYSKAHKILKIVEENTGHKLLQKSRGGSEHGGSLLTDYAKRLIFSYKEFQSKVKDFSEKEFEQNILKILE